jgi:hypothetical protein
MAELAKSAKEAAKHSSDSDSETEERRKLLGIGDVYKSSNTAVRAAAAARAHLTACTGTRRTFGHGRNGDVANRDCLRK